MISIVLRVATPNGNVLGYVNNYSNLTYVLRADGRIGACSFTVPLYMTKFFDTDIPDMRITIWRSVNNQIAKLEGSTEYLTSQYVLTDETITVTAVSLNDLLRRRIIAYKANDTTYTKFTSQPTGNIMKQLVRQNMSSGIVAARDGDDTNANITNLTVAANTSDGVTASIACSRNNLYDTIQALAQNSQQSGSWIIGNISSNGIGFTFDTLPRLYGIDRRFEQPLSLANGNIEQIEFSYDYSQESNFIVSGGAGTGVSRIIGTSNPIGTNAVLTPYSRKEYFYSNPQLRTQNDANTASAGLQRALRPVYSFTCQLIQTPNYVRGISYDIGDILTVSFNNKRYATRLDIIEVTINEKGISEKAELRLL